MTNRIARHHPIIGPVCLACALVAISGSSMAHHGVAGLGAAGLRGPGAPIEAATSATLPAGKTAVRTLGAAIAAVGGYFLTLAIGRGL